MPTPQISLGTAEAAVRAAAEAAGVVQVALAGRTEPWNPDAVIALLRDADRLGWETPPAGPAGFDLLCQVGPVSYRIQVTAPVGAAA